METFLEYAGLAIIPLFMLHDWLRRKNNRQYETPKFWALQGMIVTTLTVALAIYIAGLWAEVTAGIFLFDLSGFGIWAGAGVGVLAYEFCHYWYHRLAHKFNFLWFGAHQMHHSVEAIDSFGANYLHPFDVAIFATINSLIYFPILGLNIEAGMLAATFAAFNAMFQHLNIKTPYWLGFIIQRPESHCVHHEKGVHAFNYADLPLWDMVFGTFKNPKPDETPIEAGFYNGASQRIIEMITFQDVSIQPEKAEVKMLAAE